MLLAGVTIKSGPVSVHLDGTPGTSFRGYRFISHAHADHLPRVRVNPDVICTEETSVLAAMRGIRVKMVSFPSNFHLVPNGHILGSAGLHIDGQFFYTGDIKLKAYSLNPPSVPKVDRLMIESTYGCTRYRFPDPESVLSEALDDIQYFLGRDIPCVLMGYPLGKAQHLQLFFDRRIESQSYVTQEIDAYNDIYCLSNMNIVKKTLITKASRADLDRKPWLLYHPMKNGDDIFLTYLKKKYGAVLMSFTGWAISQGYTRMTGADLAYPLSDHADFDELFSIVDATDPKKVLVLKGHSDDFIWLLKKKGYDADEVPNGHTAIQI